MKNRKHLFKKNSQGKPPTTMMTSYMKGSSTNGQAVFSQTQLDEAFNHFNDIMDRCLCSFVLFGETARSIKQDEKLQGDGIYAGVRILDFTQSTSSMLTTMASNVDIHLGIENFKKTEKVFNWEFKGIPIRIKLVHRRYKFIDNPDFVWYYAENYKIPNPFNKYWKMRFLIQ